MAPLFSFVGLLLHANRSTATTSSRSSPKPQHTLLSVPQEILDGITDHLSPEDTWTLKLTCQAMNDRVRNVPQTLTSWGTFQVRYETSIQTKQPLARACHTCRKIRFIAQYSDEDRNIRTVPAATCIGCHIKRGHYDIGKRFTMNGVLCWPCFGCNAAKPLCTMQPIRREYSDKCFCHACWAKGIHLAIPLTRWTGDTDIW